MVKIRNAKISFFSPEEFLRLNTFKLCKLCSYFILIHIKNIKKSKLLQPIKSIVHTHSSKPNPDRAQFQPRKNSKLAKNVAQISLIIITRHLSLVIEISCRIFTWTFHYRTWTIVDICSYIKASLEQRLAKILTFNKIFMMQICSYPNFFPLWDVRSHLNPKPRIWAESVYILIHEYHTLYIFLHCISLI